jgi:ADP-ribose pyrophosphatase YjhB (NUDIX family)
MNLFWRAQEGVLYRSWIGDERHSVSVDAQVEGNGYSAAFKITGETCELWLFPISVRVRRKTDSISESATRRALVLNLPKREVEISKHSRRELLQPGEVSEKEVEFTWIRYAVNVKQISSTDEIRLLEWQKSSSLVPERQMVRKRGTAIVDTDQGIVLVSNSSRLFILPGGGAKKGEDRMDAAMRELKYQTGLEPQSCRYLFSFDEPEDKKLRNLHKVYLVEVSKESAKAEKIKRRIEHWQEGSKLKLSNSTRLIIDQYMREFKTPSFNERNRVN